MTPLAWQHDLDWRRPALVTSVLDVAQVSGRNSSAQTPTVTDAPARTHGGGESQAQWLLEALGSLVDPTREIRQTGADLFATYSTPPEDVTWDEGPIGLDRF